MTTNPQHNMQEWMCLMHNCNKIRTVGITQNLLHHQISRTLEPPFPLGIKGAPCLHRSSLGVLFRAFCLHISKLYCREQHNSMAPLWKSRSTIFAFAEPGGCQTSDWSVLSSSCHSLHGAVDLTCEYNLDSASSDV